MTGIRRLNRTDAARRDKMNLLQEIEAAMRDAMRAGDERRTRTLRMVMAAAQNRRIELGRPLSEEEVGEVLGRQAKQRRESIDQFRAGGREELAAEEEAELAILTEYLPKQLSRPEIEQMVRDAIDETGASGPREMGRVMGRLMPRTRGRVDGSLVSQVVREMLSDRAG